MARVLNSTGCGWCLSTILVGFIGLAGLPVYGGFLYVDDDAPLGGDGQSWSTAYKYLQDALLVAEDDTGVHEIRIAGGVYTPDKDEIGHYAPGNPAAFFDTRSDLAIIGGYRGLAAGGNPDDRDIALFETVLSGDLDGDDAPYFQNMGDNSRTVLSTSGTDATAIVDGVTISAGFDYVGGSGGIQNTSGAPVFRNCTFRDNQGVWGGGIFSVGESEITLIGCLFLNNRASSRGGGAYFSSNASLINCAFRANHALEDGGAILSSGDLLCVNCEFIGNQAGLEEVDCDGQPDSHGGGLFQSEGTLAVSNCVFSHNFTAGTGGGIFLWETDDAEIANCIFQQNRRCDGEHNFGAMYGSYTLSYCCIATDWPGSHLIDADPLFVREANPGPDGYWMTADDDFGDHRLQSESPCIDAGSNTSVPSDSNDLDNDGDILEPLPVDYGWLLRSADRLDTPDTGFGTSPIVDMGVFEYQCGGDLNGDGIVDLSDLSALLANYGTTVGGYADGDLDHNGHVDLADLAGLLANYGIECL